MENFLNLEKQYKARALENMQEAKLLADSHIYLGAASRAYYACLHTMHYHLIQKGIQTKTHKQTHTEFRKNFIRKGNFGKEESILIDQLFKLRQASDYDPLFSIEEATFKEIFRNAEKFVESV